MYNIADHGLHRKWKKPVAYFLSYECTTTEMLVQFLNEVLGACQNMGLHVVATVCDMGTNSVKAMNCWVQPQESHSSSFKFEQLQQHMTIHTSISALITCF